MSTLENRFLDLDLNFISHPATGDIVKLKDERSVQTSMKNILFTKFYERKFNPSLGSNLRDLLFEQMHESTAASIETEIKNTITNFEPRVQVLGVQVLPDYDGNRYDITITFFMKNTPEPLEFNFFLERVR